MNKCWKSLGLMAVLLCLCISLGNATSVIKCQDATLDLGNLDENSVVSHNFYLENLGLYPIKILDVRKSCGCTNASYDTSIIGVKQKATLSVEFSPKLSGKVESLIRITWQVVGGTNEMGTTDVSLMANVLTVLNYTPHFYDFGNISADAGPREFTLSFSKGDANIDWNDIQTSSGLCKLSSIRKGPNSFLVTISFDPSKKPCGSFHDEIDVKVLNNNVLLPIKYKIPIRGTISSEVMVKPSVLFLGLISDGNPISGQFQVVSKDKTPLTFIALESSAPNFFIAKFVRNTGQELLFDYHTIPQKKTGENYGTLLLKVRGDKERSISLPFFGFVKTKA